MEYFQCLLCNSVLPSLWKAEGHWKERHASESSTVQPGNEISRTIRKLTFAQCFVQLQRVQQTQNVDAGQSFESETEEYLSGEEDESSDNSDSTTTQRRRRNRHRKHSQPSPYNRDLRFKCHRCTSTFPKKSQLARHLYTEHRKEEQDNLAVCPLTTCQAVCMVRSSFKNHFDAHFKAERKQNYNQNKPPDSDSVSQQFTSKYFQEPFFFCKFCLERTVSLEELQLHQENFHSSFRLRCGHCSKEDFGGSVISFIGHVKTAHGSKLFPASWKNVRVRDAKEEEEVVEVSPPEIQELVCKVCGVKFLRKEELRYHLQYLHMKDSPFQCQFPECGRGFPCRKYLTDHYAQHVPRECPFCHKNFSRNYRLTGHLKSVHKADPEVVLAQMKKEAKVTETFRKVGLANGIKLVPVPENGAVATPPDFESRPEVEQRVLVKLEAPVEKHEVMDVESTPVVERMVEVKLETEPGSKIKSVSGATTTSIPEWKIAQAQLAELGTGQRMRISVSNINAKSRAGADKLIFSCPHCSSIFARSWTLQQHMKETHKEEVTPHIKDPSLLCSHCGYPAKSKTDLSNHTRKSHGPQSRWRCPHTGCGIPLRTKAKLNTHIRRLHKNGTKVEERYPCPHCPDLGFRTRPELFDHVKETHDGKGLRDLRKQCPYCEKLIMPVTFGSHVKKCGSGKKKKGTKGENKCQLCQDTFSTKLVLKRHIEVIHLGIPVNKLGRERRESRKEKLNRNKKSLNVKTEKEATSEDVVLKKETRSEIILGI